MCWGVKGGGEDRGSGTSLRERGACGRTGRGGGVRGGVGRRGGGGEAGYNGGLCWEVKARSMAGLRLGCGWDEIQRLLQSSCKAGRCTHYHNRILIVSDGRPELSQRRGQRALKVTVCVNTHTGLCVTNGK